MCLSHLLSLSQSWKFFQKYECLITGKHRKELTDSIISQLLGMWKFSLSPQVVTTLFGAFSALQSLRLHPSAAVATALKRIMKELMYFPSFLLSEDDAFIHHPPPPSPLCPFSTSQRSQGNHIQSIFESLHSEMKSLGAILGGPLPAQFPNDVTSSDSSRQFYRQLATKAATLCHQAGLNLFSTGELFKM